VIEIVDYEGPLAVGAQDVRLRKVNVRYRRQPPHDVDELAIAANSFMPQRSTKGSKVRLTFEPFVPLCG